MKNSKKGFPTIVEKSEPIQIGFIPDGDCAPIAVARESGLFDKYELDVQLRRETRLSNIRDRMVEGELDAVHAPATLPFITNLGIDSDHCACVTGMILSLQGNAITISRHLWDEGVRDGKTLRDVIFRNWGKRTFTFGVVFPYSPAFLLLRRWLREGRVSPCEVRIVVVPPAQMFPTLKLGYIDGFCAGEPWTSLAVEAEAGVCVATSREIAPLHPEKVLMVRHDFAERRASEHERLIAALLEACAFCDQPANRPLISEMLAQPQYVNAPTDCLKNILGVEDPEMRPEPESAPLHIFYKYNANDPTDDKATWVLGHLYEMIEQRALPLPPSGRTPMLKNIFRRDIFQRAKAAVFDQTQALMTEAQNFGAAPVTARDRFDNDAVKAIVE
ncbi:MAG TPA: CmpA/NrtA family ABC transporter substrate-binding protein [Verrucomicrobiae bacterium]|jgi:ABC-type nitrate/sulfonate/bicarbonate transport system substrate-binding protein|nr:CmpA/NrtA family ABC transporter substrate-binding protein [Verrucomicrobiae bacterium]